MNSITMNFDDGIDINAVYNKLRKQYPKSKITKNNKTLDEMLEDEYLLALSLEREKNGSGRLYSEEEVMQELGITEYDIEEAEDLEIE